MNKLWLLLLIIVLSVPSLYSQKIPGLKINDKSLLTQDIHLLDKNGSFVHKSFVKPVQLKNRKAVNKYFGAGYSFVIFTDKIMNSAYPVVDTRNGNFLTDINLYFGFAIAQAVTLEIEPSILFTNNTRYNYYLLSPPVNIGGVDYSYGNTNSVSMLAFPVAVNARFFPFFKQTGFMRLFFVGGAAGVEWIREEYQNVYSNTPGAIYIGSGPLVDETTSQWAPLFRLMTGFTGNGGQFGYGGEIRYNIIPLKATNQPFATRQAKNYNSVDLTLRFYFSL